MGNSLYQLNQELISYETYKRNILIEIKDTVINLNSRTTAVERVYLNMVLYYERGHF